MKKGNISLANINLKSKMSKYHHATLFMSTIGKIQNNILLIYIFNLNYNHLIIKFIMIN